MLGRGHPLTSEDRTSEGYSETLEEIYSSPADDNAIVGVLQHVSNTISAGKKGASEKSIGVLTTKSGDAFLQPVWGEAAVQLSKTRDFIGKVTSYYNYYYFF